MTAQPVTHSQQHTKSTDDPEYWERILHDAGLPSEPPPHRQLSPLPADSRNDYGDQTNFFDRNSKAIFEAQQQWKQSGGYPFTCLFCGVKVVGAPKGTKYCCGNHRKRHNEGKTYEHIMCEGDGGGHGCGREIFPVFDDVVRVEGKRLCPRCVYIRKFCTAVGVSTIEEFRAFCERKHKEISATREAQWNKIKELYR